MPHAAFVPLRIQSSYSMLEGAIQPKGIAAACVKMRIPAAALVDRNVMFGAMEFTDYCMGAGVQPIIGALLGVARPGEGHAIDYLALLAQTQTGYDNLTALISAAHLDSDPMKGPNVTLDQIAVRAEGLIALTAGADGALARLLAEEQRPAAEVYLDRLQAIFADRLYIEIARSEERIEMASEAALIDLAYARDLPLVATNPAAFIDESFAPAHDVMLCIAESSYVEQTERRHTNPHQYLKSPRAMEALFADLPEALANTVVIAQRCAVKAPNRKPILPSLAGDREAEAKALEVEAQKGLAARLAFAGITGAAEQPYHERLAFEVDVINRMGFAGYFLIVADFIQWAKSQGIPVGPGRGSGAGSLVAWALTITDLDPLKLGLLFERFLNPERVSMPDFDIDFCETRREEVIRYVQQRYGRDQVAQIITFGKMKARAVLKDVGRVLQMSYGQVDRLAKLVPNHPSDPWTLERAVGGVSELAAERERDPNVRRLLDMAMKLEGLPRHSSTHAAGVVIGDRPLSQLVPMYRDPRSDMPVTQFDMKWVEKAGLVKFDFLGLKTLSVLQRAVDLLKQRDIDLDLARIPWDDSDVFELLARGDTVGVFQLESEGMRRTLAQVKPDKFEDIIALVSLYRPGPMDNIPTYANRKHGQEAPDYLHPMLEEVLKETYGVIIYQEQVMQIAQILAGYSLGEADLLRRAMGKKQKSEMDAQKARFIEGATEKGVEPATSSYIFELVEKFAGYGFNKSHAAAYALVAYQTAYVKAKYPVEFFAASMAYDITQTDKLSLFRDDMKRLGVPCLPPCLNASEADFSVEDGAVRYALAALKGVGEKAMESLVELRKQGGPFASLSDFVRRIDPKLLNRRQIESLASAGAFDAIEPNRAAVHDMAEALLATASAHAESRNSLQGGLFGEAESFAPSLLVPNRAPWPLAEAMAHEKDCFGFFFGAHPLDEYAMVIAAQGGRSYAAICASDGPAEGGRTSAVMAGFIDEVRWRTPQTGKGGRYMLLTMSDASGQYGASCFDDDVQPQAEALAAENAAVLLNVELMWRPGEDTPRVTVRGLSRLTDLAKRARMRLSVEIADHGAVAALRASLGARGSGRSEVLARIDLGQGRWAAMALERHIELDSNVCEAVARIAGVTTARLEAV